MHSLMGKSQNDVTTGSVELKLSNLDICVKHGFELVEINLVIFQ